MASHWFSEFDFDEPSFFQFTEQQVEITLNEDQNLHQSTSSRSNTNKRSKKLLKPNSRDSNPSSSAVVSFGTQEVFPKGFFGGIIGGVKPKEEADMALNINNNNKNNNDKIYGDEMKNGDDEEVKKSNQHHILAERGRRERLNQGFIALSKIVPGLKKMDKASVLGDAIEYLKQLEDKVQTLETQATQKTLESSIMVNKYLFSSNKHDEEENKSPWNGNFNNNNIGIANGLQEIEAKMYDRTILIKIRCKKQKGVLVKALNEIERLGLRITSTNVIPFTGSTVDITAMAMVEEEFSMSVKDIVKMLKMSLEQFM